MTQCFKLTVYTAKTGLGILSIFKVISDATCRGFPLLIDGRLSYLVLNRPV